MFPSMGARCSRYYLTHCVSCDPLAFPRLTSLIELPFLLIQTPRNVGRWVTRRYKSVMGDRAEDRRIIQYTFLVPLWCLSLMSFASNFREPELHIILEGFCEHGVKPTLIGATSPLFRSTRALYLSPHTFYMHRRTCYQLKWILGTNIQPIANDKHCHQSTSSQPTGAAED